MMTDSLRPTRLADEGLPVFNLKAVVQETGISAPTLRAWERRYGLPCPQRAPSGRRLYSRRDIETVRWLARRVAGGMTIGQAVALWRALEEAGRDPLVASFPTPPERSPAEREVLERWRDAWIAACLAFDEAAADAAFGQALAALPPEVACTEVLQAGLAWIGEAWYRGDATVHQEHFAAHLAARRVQALLAMSPPVSCPDPVLVLCPPGEQHTFGPLLLTYLLRRAGWRVVYLGADLPVEDAAAAVRRTAPRWVIASAYHLPPVVGIQALSLLLQEMGVPLAFGGRVFNQVPALRARIAGHFLGERMEEAPKRLKEWTISPPLSPSPASVPEEYRRICRLYQDREWAIRARVLSLLSAQRATRVLPGWLAEYTFAHIRSALLLGDIALADVYVDWLRALRDGLSLAPGWVGPFLEAYRKGMGRYLGGDGGPLIEWLDRKIRAEEG